MTSEPINDAGSNRHSDYYRVDDDPLPVPAPLEVVLLPLFPFEELPVPDPLLPVPVVPVVPLVPVALVPVLPVPEVPVPAVPTP